MSNNIQRLAAQLGGSVHGGVIWYPSVRGGDTNIPLQLTEEEAGRRLAGHCQNCGTILDNPESAFCTLACHDEWREKN